MNHVRFLHALRITKYLELMSEEKYNYLLDCNACRYISLSFLTNIFKRVTAISPADYQ